MIAYTYYRYDGIVDLSSAECYDPNCNKWSAVTSLGTKRSCLGISASHGLLYVCGGFDGASCLSSVERYDPLTGVWSSCPSMTTRRRYCRVSVVGKVDNYFNIYLCLKLSRDLILNPYRRWRKRNPILIKIKYTLHTATPVWNDLMK